MVKIDLHKYGKGGSINLEDDVEFHELENRLGHLVAIMKDTILDMGIKPYKDSEETDVREEVLNK